MGDLRSGSNWMVNPNQEVEIKWVDVEIQAKKSQIVRLEQDIEDLRKGKLLELEACVIMRKKELEMLEEKKHNLKNSIEVERK